MNRPHYITNYTRVSSLFTAREIANNGGRMDAAVTLHLGSGTHYGELSTLLWLETNGDPILLATAEPAYDQWDTAWSIEPAMAEEWSGPNGEWIIPALDTISAQSRIWDQIAASKDIKAKANP